MDLAELFINRLFQRLSSFPYNRDSVVKKSKLYINKVVGCQDRQSLRWCLYTTSRSQFIV